MTGRRVHGVERVKRHRGVRWNRSRDAIIDAGPSSARRRRGGVDQLLTPVVDVPALDDLGEERLHDRRESLGVGIGEDVQGRPVRQRPDHVLRDGGRRLGQCLRASIASPARRRLSVRVCPQKTVLERVVRDR